MSVSRWQLCHVIWIFCIFRNFSLEDFQLFWNCPCFPYLINWIWRTFMELAENCGNNFLFRTQHHRASRILFECQYVKSNENKSTRESPVQWCGCDRLHNYFPGNAIPIDSRSNTFYCSVFSSHAHKFVSRVSSDFSFQQWILNKNGNILWCTLFHSKSTITFINYYVIIFNYLLKVNIWWEIFIFEIRKIIW